MIELAGNHLWQSTLCTAVAALLAVTLRRNRAQVRYWLWLAASVKFLVPFAAVVAIGSQFGGSSSLAVRSDVAIAIDAVGRPFSPSRPEAAPGTAAPTAAHGGTTTSALLPVAALAAPLMIWLGGCGALALVWTLRWKRVAAAVRGGARVEDSRELQALRRLEQMRGSRTPLEVVSFDTPIAPGVFGILRPVLLWPRRMTERLPDEQVEAILAHELCHVRRRDNLAAAVHAVVEIVFWFHPFVWWVGARLVRERERACDEEVVRLGSDPRVYAESILEACQFSIESPRVCVAGMTGSDLKKRIERILTNDRGEPLNAWRRLLLGAAGVARSRWPARMALSARTSAAPRRRA
jgi:bla regulator protein BlaR1